VQESFGANEYLVNAKYKGGVFTCKTGVSELRLRSDVEAAAAAAQSIEQALVSL